MKPVFMAAAAAVFFGLATASDAAVYSINNTFGDISISGFLETDGTTGTFASRTGFGEIIDSFSVTVSAGGTTSVYDVINFGAPAPGAQLTFAVTNSMITVTSAATGTSGGRLFTVVNEDDEVPFVLDFVGTTLIYQHSALTSDHVTTDVDSLVFSAAAVPLPASFPLLLAGLLGLGAFRRARRG